MTHILPSADDLIYLSGTGEKAAECKPVLPYDELVCDFLSSLSKLLLSDEQARFYPDITSFAFWCRKANLSRLKDSFNDTFVRLGLGLVFHITPSNAPINFAFSYAFSLLAGNANIVRVPTKDFPQVSILCKAVNKLFDDNKYKQISDMTCFIKYSQNDAVTQAFSRICDARIIWGGDETIRNIRKMPIPERSVDFAFADRYSFCVINPSCLNESGTNIEKLCQGFYNDTFLMDQNACSSPHLIIWLGNDNTARRVQDLFWEKLCDFVVKKYNLQPVNAVDKYTWLCKNSIDLNNIRTFKKKGNYIYRLELETLDSNIHELRGSYGYFYEYFCNDINEVAHIVNKRYQTLTYFGISKEKLTDFVLSNRLTGIDRIVPIGSALDISVIWDGFDLIRSLSRICNII